MKIGHGARKMIRRKHVPPSPPAMAPAPVGSGTRTPSDEGEASLRLELLGGPRLFANGEVVRLSGLRLNLLCVLAVAGKEGEHRHQLIRILWGKEPDAKYRHSLSQTLHSLRSKVEPLLDGPLTVAEGELLFLRPGVVATDVAEVYAALRKGEPSNAKDTLAGGFLEDLSLDHRNGEAWVSSHRQRFREEMRDLASRALDEAELRAHWERMAEAAEVLLVLDPSDEGALRELIRARGAKGEVREARAAYRRFKERIKSQGLEEEWRPSSETQHLLGNLRSVAAAPHAMEARVREDPPLVGRQVAYRTLAQAIGPPFDEGFYSTVIRGEAGWGKTRLAEEALARVSVDGVLTLKGRCSEFETVIPLSPLLEALNHPTVRAVAHELEDPWIGVILDLFPKLKDPDEEPPDVLRIHGGGPHRRLLEAIRVLMERLATHRPLVILLDDLQWADETTRAVLDYVRGRWQKGVLRLIVTVRPEEFNTRPVVRRFCERLATPDDGRTISLDNLSPDESRELVSLVGDGNLDETTQAQVRNLGQGSPLFLIEFAQEALRGRVLYSEDSTDGNPEPGTVRLPKPIQQLVDARLDTLDRTERLVLELLCVADRPLRSEDLASIMNLPQGEIAWAMRQLEEARFTRSGRDGHGVTHTVFTHGVYNRIPNYDRAQHHRAIARTLLQSGGPTELARVALHFHRAGDAENARNHALQAAERSQESGAVGEVAQLLTLARENAEDDLQDAEIVRRLGLAHYRHRDFKAAMPFLSQAVSRLRSMGRDQDAILAAIYQLDVRANEEWDERRQCLEELQELKQEAAATEHWQALLEAFDIELRLLDSAAEEEGVRRALSEAEAYLGEGPRWADCRILAAHSLCVYYRNPSEALEHCQQAVSIANSHDDEAAELFSLNRLIKVLLAQGDLGSSDGIKTLQRAQTLAERTGDLLQRFSPFANLGVWLLDIGRLDEADIAFQDARAILADTPGSTIRRNFHTNLGELRLHQGWYHDALDHFDLSKHDNASTGLPHYDLITRSGQGLAYFLLQQHERVDPYVPDPETVRAIKSFDPYIPAMLLIRRWLAQGELSLAYDFFSAVCDSISGRLVPPWIKLHLHFSKLIAPVDKALATKVAQAGAEVAHEKELTIRTNHFQALLKRLS